MYLGAYTHADLHFYFDRPKCTRCCSYDEYSRFFFGFFPLQVIFHLFFFSQGILPLV